MGFGVEAYAASNRLRAPRGAWLVGESGVATLAILFQKGEREQEIQRAQSLFPESKIMVMGELPPSLP